ncbi:P-loop containing nucleoside triphosphate hydrolase protein [Chytridium lagenaria]|nr:P-loop containing nucleoside triphosphate hydrolase protein [Chytridium lagenaria]
MDTRKVVVVGSAACGKTALISRAVNNTFSNEYLQTFGADLMVKTSSDSKKFSLQIWSCGGHERYRALFEQFYVDVNSSVLPRITIWYNEIRRMTPSALIILVGTKSDESDSVAIKVQDALKQAREWNVEFRSISAKTGTNVNELFEYILENLS